MIKRILIIGFGSIALRHHRNLKSLLPNCKFAFLTKKKRKVKNFTILNNLTLAKDFKPNITVICSPANKHIYYARIFSKLNSNLFIEKPVSTNLNELKKFIRNINKRRITIISGYNLRHDESLINFKKFINKKLVGDILAVKSDVGQYLPNWRKKDYRTSVSSKKELGGGVINELSHDVDILYVLFKKIKFYFGINYKISRLKINTEDTSHAIFKSSFNKKNFFIYIGLDFYRHDTTRTCTVIGSKATVKWDGIKKKITIYKKNMIKPIFYNYDKNKNLSYLNQIKFFIDSIYKRKTLQKDFKVNIKLVETLNLMRKKKCYV